MMVLDTEWLGLDLHIGITSLTVIEDSADDDLNSWSGLLKRKRRENRVGVLQILSSSVVYAAARLAAPEGTNSNDSVGS